MSFNVEIAKPHPDMITDSPNAVPPYLLLTSGRALVTDRTLSGPIKYNYATMNAVRRAIHSYVSIWGFEQYLDEKDYKFLTEEFGIKNLAPNHTRLSVTVDTTELVLVALPHRCSRIPIMTGEQTDQFLQSTDLRLVYFLICDGLGEDNETTREQFARPFTNEHNITKCIYARDLVPVVYTRAKPDAPWQYNNEESAKLGAQRSAIFAYNVPVICVGLGKKVHAFLKPMRGKTGADNSQYCPCVPRYRFSADPKWYEEGEGPIETFVAGQGGNQRPNTIRRKVQDERGFKAILLSDPRTGAPYDKLGQPYAIQLMVEYNGKMGVVDATLAALTALVDGVNLLKLEYENIAQTIVFKETHNDTQTVYIPRNTEDKIIESNPKTKILVDDTIANIMKFKMLEILGRIIGENHSWYARTNISYKIPHELVPQCVYTITLPLHDSAGHDDGAFHGKFCRVMGTDIDTTDFHYTLVMKACQEVLDDLIEMQRIIHAEAMQAAL